MSFDQPLLMDPGPVVCFRSAGVRQEVPHEVGVCAGALAREAPRLAVSPGGLLRQTDGAPRSGGAGRPRLSAPAGTDALHGGPRTVVRQLVAWAETVVGLIVTI